ncbi:hypothetical protein [Kyrpidia tusciae]|uniref:hypothetical protein n=1 Tax=Kyrpidia tusciae TaxID=33943 RepID=UPI00145EA026|nr:hypothetical protein [Kyrpidia tusciae]
MHVEIRRRLGDPPLRRSGLQADLRKLLPNLNLRDQRSSLPSAAVGSGGAIRRSDSATG